MEKNSEMPVKSINLSAMSRNELEEFAMKKSIENEELSAKIAYYEEQIRRERARRFGRSSEVLHEGQISFFNEAEQESEALHIEPKDEAAPNRKKQRGRKKAITRNLPRKRIDHVLSKEEQECPKCGGALCEMKTEIRTEIEWVPAKAVAVDHVRHFYVCRNCDKNGTQGTIIAADAPNGMFRNSLASPSLVSDVCYKKYGLAQPLYRQEQELNRMGLPIDRNTLANWMIKASTTYLEPLYTQMHTDLLTRGIIHSDDTEVEVLREPGREASTKSYMWLYRTGSDTDKPIVLYEYTPGRAATYPITFLGDYCGYLQADGYAGYHKLEQGEGTGPPGVTICGCWAHARRGFVDVVKGLPSSAIVSGSVTEKALGYIDALFKIERKSKGFSAEARLSLRMEKAAPIMDEFFAWLKTIQNSCVGSLGKAVNYCVNQEKYLRNYLLDGDLEISNNRAERSVKPFVIGRKNWLFCNTPNGAKASAIIYSIIETTKENGLDARAYLEHIFTTFKDTDISALNLCDFMPWSPALPPSCRPNAAAVLVDDAGGSDATNGQDNLD
jgi:transposase